MQITPLTPMLKVSNSECSLECYQKLAGFELISLRQAVDQWRWAWIRSGAAELMLAESGGPATRVDQIDPAQDNGWPAIYYCYPDNVEDLHAAVQRQAFQVSDLRVTVYGMMEFEVRGPDGHILWFGHETDEPPTPESQSA